MRDDFGPLVKQLVNVGEQVGYVLLFLDLNNFPTTLSFVAVIKISNLELFGL